jgi:prevent-host-death family protein
MATVPASQAKTRFGELLDRVARGEQIVFTRHFAAGGEPSALMLSDFFTSTQLRNSIQWELTCKAVGIDRSITLPVAGSAPLSGVSLCRRGRDFTERERLLLNLLRPHYNQAFENARLTSALLARCAEPVQDYALTPRELEVARWVGQGKTNPEIAIILETSVRTVEKHMERILGKLGAENRTAVALMMARADALPRGSGVAGNA